MIAKGADTLVLGRTHFPFLRAALQQAAGPKVTLIDPAAAVARELTRRLAGARLLTPANSPGVERFWTSGNQAQGHTVIARLWERDVRLDGLQACVTK